MSESGDLCNSSLFKDHATETHPLSKELFDKDDETMKEEKPEDIIFDVTVEESQNQESEPELEPESQYQCQKCEDQFSNLNDLGLHLNNAHGKGRF